MSADTPAILQPVLPGRARGGRLRGVLLLAFVTLLWGTTFVVMRALVTNPAGAMAPAVLILSRFVLATILFMPFLRWERRLWLAGLELGFWSWLSYQSQAVGLLYTTASRSAFITSLHVIFVPTLTAAAGRRVSGLVWLAAAMAFAGTGLLSYDGSPPNRGDAWTLVTALAYAAYILRLEAYAGRFPSLPLTAVQLGAVTLCCGAWVAIERPPVRWVGPVAAAGVVYLAVACTALTTWLQVIGQRAVPSYQVALLYTMEPVWAAAFAWAAFGERFGPRGWVGATLLVAAAVMSQWPGRPWRKSEV